MELAFSFFRRTFFSRFFTLAPLVPLIRSRTRYSFPYHFQWPTLDVSRTTLFREHFLSVTTAHRLLNFGKQFTPNRFVRLQEREREEKCSLENWDRSVTIAISSDSNVYDVRCTCATLVSSHSTPASRVETTDYFRLCGCVYMVFDFFAGDAQSL